MSGLGDSIDYDIDLSDCLMDFVNDFEPSLTVSIQDNVGTIISSSNKSLVDDFDILLDFIGDDVSQSGSSDNNDNHTGTSSASNSTILSSAVSISTAKTPVEAVTVTTLLLPREPITHLMPLRTSVDFCMGLSHAFNGGDYWTIADLVLSFTHQHTIFRMKDDVSSFHTSGNDKIIRYFHKLMDSFADGVMFVKKVMPTKRNGHRILRSKFYFTGTKVVKGLVNSSESNDTTVVDGGNVTNTNNTNDTNITSDVVNIYKVSTKGLATMYLDRNNRIVIFDDTVQSILRNRPSDRRMYYGTMEGCFRKTVKIN